MSADIVDVGFGVRVLHAGKDGWGVVDDAAEEADLYADMDKAILFAREIALEKVAERVLDQDAEIARLRELLKDIAAVHVNILRGNIAMTREQAQHIAGATDYDSLRAEVEALRARVAEQDEHCLRLGEEISHLRDGARGLGERGG